MTQLLIVEDEADVREFMTNFFRKRNISVLAAANGAEALDLIRKDVPSLILLDIQMPGMDGIETLRKIRQITLAAKVIMVTGKSPENENAFEECKKMGVADYIHKPLELDALEKKVLKELSTVFVKNN